MEPVKTRFLGIAALCLLTSAALAAASQHTQLTAAAPNSDSPHLSPLIQFKVDGELDAAAARTSIVYDGNWVYLNLPDSLLRGTAPLGSSPKLETLFTPASRAISRVYAYDHILYVLSRAREKTADHTLFRSTDGGKSFLAIDAALLECADGLCTHLESTQLLARGRLIYVNAGGGRNLLVSDTRGASYKALSGEVGNIACYHGTFALIGHTALLGGECGLDMAYIERGILSEDGLSVASPFQPVQTPANTPSLWNRKVSVIANDPGTSLVLAGAEGALLRSTDEGKSFEYAIRYPAEGGPYPYVGHILFPTSQSSKSRHNLILIAGFDKSDFKPYLAYGTRDGRSWTDISQLLAASGDNVVTGLAEDPSGRLLVAAADQAAGQISVYELLLGSDARGSVVRCEPTHSGSNGTRCTRAIER
jgi:hypothetical protein